MTEIPSAIAQRRVSYLDQLNQGNDETQYKGTMSHLWETAEGVQWLRLLVFGVIYCFGIKGGTGSESLSAFFHLLHLEQQVGCSA